MAHLEKKIRRATAICTYGGPTAAGHRPICLTLGKELFNTLVRVVTSDLGLLRRFYCSKFKRRCCMFVCLRGDRQ